MREFYEQVQSRNWELASKFLTFLVGCASQTRVPWCVDKANLDKKYIQVQHQAGTRTN